MEFEQWFRRGDLLYQAPFRQDHYLIFPSSTALGVKFREGRLEIKALAKTLGVRTLAADTAGQVQLWEKWSCLEPSFAAFDPLLQNDARLWVTVGKERLLRKFSLENDSMAEVRADTVFPTDGCNIELTKIVVRRQVSWSFNFEAYGNPSRVEGYVKLVAERFLAHEQRPRQFKTTQAPDDSLSAQNSFSYPEWLGRLANKG